MALRLSGWRKTAALNIAGISSLFFGLLVCLVVSTVRAGGLTRVLILFEGPCKQSRRLNLGLHLLINVVSSAILASANFFMQVLTSPSRGEIDNAHLKARYLEIGVQSLLNFSHFR